MRNSPTEVDFNFTGLWLGFVHPEIKLGVHQPLQAHEIKNWVERGVNIFMRIYGVRDENNRFLGYCLPPALFKKYPQEFTIIQDPI